MSHEDGLKKLIAAIFTVHREGEMDCDSCSQQFHCLGEMVARGANLAELLPAVEAHLRCCPDCTEEFQALITIIRSENNPASS